MASRYRIGLIGAGARGETFARQLHEETARKATLFGVCDIDQERLDKFCDYCNLTGAQRFTDVEAFVNQKDLDAVIITTPEFTHAEVAIAAMKAGKPVYMEKPMAHTIGDCQKIIRTQEETGTTAYVGFNLRAHAAYAKAKEVIDTGVLGQIVAINAYEQLAYWHGASYMRRFHRKTSQSGGLLNHKCSHDLDIMLWFIGHQHKVTRIASFGGTNVLTPDKQPAKFCHECPQDVYDKCVYRARSGYFFPINESKPYYMTGKTDVYGADLCVYDGEKDIVDNQQVMMEWDNGVRGTFSLQMFQHDGKRQTTIWGENGLLQLDRDADVPLRVTHTETGDRDEYHFTPRAGGHGGSDSKMIERFVHAFETGDMLDSDIYAGLAASLVAIKADESRLSGKMVQIAPDEYLRDSKAALAAAAK